ncbi:MAG TPA: winged helix-turn-helix domain-containing protein [Pyrinomonadaceae bacterium]
MAGKDPTTYRFDDFIVDLENFRLSRDGVDCALTPRAFDVLVYLIRHRGRVVEKQEIFDAIWKDSFVTDDALTRIIKEIRRELGDVAGSPNYIATVRKRGYKFVAAVEEAIESAEEAAGKTCPNCGKRYPDRLNFCLDDGMPLGSGSGDPEATRMLPMSPALDETVPHVLSGERISSDSGRNRRSVRLGVFGILLATAMVVTTGYIGYRLFGVSAGGPIRSLAVIPLVNESGNRDIEYLSDGITESLVGSLSEVPGLEVKSRSSVLRYKDTDVPASIVGRDLNVEAIVTGRLIQRGEEIAVYVSLVEAATENNLWSKQYIRRLENLITLENEIARDIAQTLSASLTSADQQKIAKTHTENEEAYQMYLKGRHHFLTTRHRGAELAIDYYRKAIELDPNYAKAYAAAVQAALGLAFRSEVPTTEAFTTARRDAEKALELDPQLAEAHLALGSVNVWFDWDWTTAESRFRRAIELAPNDEAAYFALGALLCNSGRMDEGFALLERARILNPLHLRNNSVYSQYLTFSGRPDEALAELSRVLELDPNFYLAHLAASQAHLEKGSYREAISAAEIAKAMNPQDSTPVTFIAYALAKQGRKAEANKKLSELLKLSDSRAVTPYNIALVYSGLGDAENTFRWLNRAVDQRDLRLAFIKVEPKWNELRTDERFAEIVRRVRIP